MVRKKKGLLKKIGCILISVSIIFTGVTFFGTFNSEADGYSGTTYTLDSGGTISVGDLDEYQSDLTDINSYGATTVESYALADFSSLNSISVSGTLDVGSYAFYGDSSLSSVTCTSMSGADATSFSGCYSIAFGISGQTIGSGYYVYNSALYNGTTLVYVPRSVGSSYTIRSGTTSIASGAFDDTTVTELNFESNSAANITSIGSHSNWPTAGTTINAYGATASDYIVEYFTTECLNAGSVIVNCDETGDSITVTITETAEDGSFEEVLTYRDQSAGSTINPTSREGYTCDDSYTVTSATEQTYTFEYTANIPVTTYTIKYQLLDSSGNEVTTQEITTTTDPGSYSPQSTYTYNETTYTLKSSTPTISGTTYIYVYIADATITTYTIKYQLLDSSGNEVTTQEITTTTDPGSYSPQSTYTYNGTAHTLVSSTPTVSGTTYTYVYKASSSNNGEGGGGNSGGGSSSGGSSSSTTVATGTVSDTAKTTQSYHIIEGAGQIVGKNDGTVKIVCDGPVDKLAYILMDGNVVDKGNYTIQSGSTILTFTANYVASLAEGDHAVQFQYTDGYAVTGLRITNGATKTTTTVTYKVSSDGSISSGHTKDTTPKTADGFDNRYLLCLGIFLLGAGAILLSRQKKLEAILAGEEEDE